MGSGSKSGTHRMYSKLGPHASALLLLSTCGRSTATYGLIAKIQLSIAYRRTPVYANIHISLRSLASSTA